jgi:hypothetical protein
VKPHVAAQRAVVRMLFDPRFAEAARRDPDRVLAALDPALRRQLVAVDDRAFRVDRLRQRRTLRTLSEEFKGSTTLALAETRSLAFLERFFESAAFHRAVDEGGLLALAYAEFLGYEIAAGKLTTPSLAGVLTIESALARARREAAAAGAAKLTAATVDEGAGDQLQLAPGVVSVTVPAGAMAALQQAERYLFEVNLMPAIALCDDAPRLQLDASVADRTPLHLVAVPTSSGVSLVTIDEPLAVLLRCLWPTPRPRSAVLAEAAARGLPPADARARLQELLADEIVTSR